MNNNEIYSQAETPMEENGGQVDSYGQGANTYGQSEEQDAAEGWAAGGGWGQGGAEEEQQQVLKRLKVSKRFKVSMPTMNNPQEWAGADWSNQQQANGEVASWSRQVR